MILNQARVSARLEAFFRLLATGEGTNLFNPWTQRDELNDSTLNSPVGRRERLKAHLQRSPARILLGEAAGYQGCRVSGIPFTSERVIMAGIVPRVSSDGQRLSIRTRPWSEPSATTVWKTLHALQIAHDTILWNAYPWHPHVPGDPHSNRTPTRIERALGMPVLDALLRIFPKAALFAVGRHAEQALLEMGRDAIPLRHPSMGGAKLFHLGLRNALHSSR
jgi:uracil-DNA glycosylase